MSPNGKAVTHEDPPPAQGHDPLPPHLYSPPAQPYDTPALPQPVSRVGGAYAGLIGFVGYWPPLRGGAGLLDGFIDPLPPRVHGLPPPPPITTDREKN